MSKKIYRPEEADRPALDHRIPAPYGDPRLKDYLVGPRRGKPIQVDHDRVDHHRVPEEGDDRHFTTALETLQRIPIIDSLDERRPTLVSFGDQVQIS